MKLTCQACGHENELGRIFCGSCGKKLDMSSLSMEQVSSESRSVPTGAIIKWTALIVLALVCVAAGLAFWPQAPLQEGVSRAGANRVRGQLGGVNNALRVGAGTSVTLDARDVNAYLDTYRAAGNLTSLTAEIRSGSMRIRAIAELGPWQVSTYSIGPLNYSYDIKCVPDGAGFKAAGAAVGRLPLPGGLSGPAVKRMAAVFDDAKAEKALLRNLSELEFETDLIRAAFNP